MFIALADFDGASPRAVLGEIGTELEPHVYEALTMGVRDYVQKNRFPGVLLGLSGGVDSALTLAVAVDALGRDRVRALMLPSVYNAAISLEDARTMAGILGVRYDEIPIDGIFKSFKHTLGGEFQGRVEDSTEENIQARIRGTLLMALSNKFGSIVLTTGNKSEMAVGYATLYGDMAGGFAVSRHQQDAGVPALQVPEQPGAGDSRAHHHAAAIGGAPARPDGSGQPSALRYPRCHSRGLRRGRYESGRYRRTRLCPGARGQGGQADQDQRVQRRQAAVGIRITRAASARTGAIRSHRRGPSGRAWAASVICKQQQEKSDEKSRSDHQAVQAR
jgi:hypothetical protein